MGGCRAVSVVLITPYLDEGVVDLMEKLRLGENWRPPARLAPGTTSSPKLLSRCDDCPATQNFEQAEPMLWAIGVPILSHLAAAALLVYWPFIAAHLGGLLLYVHGDSLEWGTPDQYYETVLGAAEPSGTIAEHLTPEANQARSFAPIELAEEPHAPDAPAPPPRAALTELDANALPALGADGEAPLERTSSSYGGWPAGRPASLALDPETPAQAPAPGVRRATSMDPAALPALQRHEEPPAEEGPTAHLRSLDAAALPPLSAAAEDAIRAAMRRGDGGAALDTWAHANRATPGLGAGELTWLAKAAAAKGADGEALAAFEAAAAAADALAAPARVLLARFLDERLGRRADAVAWMQRVVAENQGTEAARFAQAWLARTAP